MVVLALSWQVTSIWIAGFVFAFLAVCGWAMFRSLPTAGIALGPDPEKRDQAMAANQAELLRSLEGLRAEMSDLRSQVSDVQRLLRDVG